MKKVNLNHINVNGIIIPALFKTKHVKTEVLIEAQEGISALNLAISSILGHGCDPNVLRLEDIAKRTGASAKKMRKNINSAIKIADRERGDNLSKKIDADELVYRLTTIVIACDGDTSNDLAGHIVRPRMDGFFDSQKIETPCDFLCHVALIDFFERNLSGERMELKQYLRRYGVKPVSCGSIMAYIKKNDWYGDEKETMNLLMLSPVGDEPPKLDSIVGAALEDFRRKYNQTEKEWNRSVVDAAAISAA